MSTCTYCHRNIGTDGYYREGREFDPALDQGPIHDYCGDRIVKCNNEVQALVASVMPLIDYINAGDPGVLADVIVAALTRSHRTLQQSFLGAVKLALHKYAGLESRMYVDPRNQAAHAWTREVDKIDNADLRFPLI